MLKRLEAFCCVRAGCNDAPIWRAFWTEAQRIVQMASRQSTSAQRQSDLPTLLVVIGTPIWMVCIIATLLVEGVDIGPLLLGMAIIGIAGTLSLLAVAVTNYLTARLRAAARLLRRHTPPRTLALLRFLRRAVWILTIPVFLLSIAGDNSGLLGLLSCLQICCFVAFGGLIIWSFIHTWRQEAQAQQQQEWWPAGRIVRRRTIPEERNSHAVLGDHENSHNMLQGIPQEQSAHHYDQPQTQYPQEMPMP